MKVYVHSKNSSHRGSIYTKWYDDKIGTFFNVNPIKDGHSYYSLSDMNGLYIRKVDCYTIEDHRNKLLESLLT